MDLLSVINKLIVLRINKLKACLTCSHNFCMVLTNLSCTQEYYFFHLKVDAWILEHWMVGALLYNKR